tara:strand:+ start:126 stop:323 length:198 start_codon:yes stop_codon:yes gene_type:complete
MKNNKLKVISDGTAIGTKVIDRNGIAIDGCESVVIEINAITNRSTCTLVVGGVEIEYEAITKPIN